MLKETVSLVLGEIGQFLCKHRRLVCRTKMGLRFALAVCGTLLVKPQMNNQWWHAYTSTTNTITTNKVIPTDSDIFLWMKMQLVFPYRQLWPAVGTGCCDCQLHHSSNHLSSPLSMSNFFLFYWNEFRGGVVGVWGGVVHFDESQQRQKKKPPETVLEGNVS